MLNILKHILLNCLSVCFIFRPSRELFTHAEMLPSQVKSRKFRPAAPRLRQSVWFLQLSKLTATRVIPFYCQSEDPWHSHHLSCVMEWDCHYPFHQLRSLNTGIKLTSLLHQGERHTNYTTAIFGFIRYNTNRSFLKLRKERNDKYAQIQTDRQRFLHSLKKIRWKLEQCSLQSNEEVFRSSYRVITV